MDRRVTALIVSAVLLAGVVVVVLVARGGDDDEGGSDLTDTSTKPVIEVPSDPPPTELEIEDIVEGDGDEAAQGDQVEVQYVGVDYDTGEEFDTSWGNPEPFQFELGAGSSPSHPTSPTARRASRPPSRPTRRSSSSSTCSRSTSHQRT